MRRIYLCIALVAIPTGAACGGSSPRPASWEELGGLTLGAPRPTGRGWVTVPIAFEDPRWQHYNTIPSKIHRITAELDGTTIDLRVTMVSGLSLRREAPYEVRLRPRASGPHEVRYRDPDGVLHRVGTVTLEARRDAARGSSFGR